MMWKTWTTSLGDITRMMIMFVHMLMPCRRNDKKKQNRYEGLPRHQLAHEMHKVLDKVDDKTKCAVHWSIYACCCCFCCCCFCCSADDNNDDQQLIRATGTWPGTSSAWLWRLSMVPPLPTTCLNMDTSRHHLHQHLLWVHYQGILLQHSPPTWCSRSVYDLIFDYCCSLQTTKI